MGDSAEVKCLRLAQRQHGCIRRDQARALGLSDRLISRRAASGRWEPLCPAVFRVEGAPRTWRQWLAAAVLWAARGCAVSHRSAATLHGFARFPEGPAELSVTRAARLGRPFTVHRVARLPDREVTTIDGLKVTTVERTLVDLCSLADVPALRASVDEALRRKKTTLDRLEAAIDRAGPTRGVAALRALIAELHGGRRPTESELEARVYDLLEASGLPRPIVQQRVVAGGKTRRLDFRVPGTPVVIEADGFAWHSAAARHETDRERDNALLERGLHVLHWTWAAVRERPDELIAQLANVLGSTPRRR